MRRESAQKSPWNPTPEEGITDPSVLLSSRRTRLSFQRTRMSADRTLMSIIRTALSLIAFGFTIFQFFHYLRDTAGATLRASAAREFGLALVILGVLLLVMGIVGHIRFMLELRRDHGQLEDEGFIPHDRFPFSVTLAAALLLLLIGLLAIIGMVTHRGPF